MARRVKRVKRIKRPAAKRWTAEERDAWIDFLKGEIIFPPATRSIAAVVKQLRGFRGKGRARGPDVMPSFDRLPEWKRHAAGEAALSAIAGRRFKRDNEMREQIYGICFIAAGDIAFLIEKPEQPKMRPEAMTLFDDAPAAAPVRSAIFDLPEDVLHLAITMTRRAIANAVEIRDVPKRRKRAA